MGYIQFNGTPKEWDALVKKNKEQKTLEEAAEKYLKEKEKDFYSYEVKDGFIDGAKWQQERMLKFILDEDNHTEGELGNSCIDVQTLVHFIEQFKKK